MKTDRRGNIHRLGTICVALALASLAACGGGRQVRSVDAAEVEEQALAYLIGAGDRLDIFVWGNDEISTSVQVRPDGGISTPLVEDLPAAGKTPTELARSIEEALSEFVRNPTVTVIVQEFVGEYERQIRVVGQAASPTSLNFRAGMSLLDVMIEVGGLSEFASGNKSKVVRTVNGEEIIINVKVKDLLNKGDMTQNIKMQPGDVLIIPESAF